MPTINADNVAILYTGLTSAELPALVDGLHDTGIYLALVSITRGAPGTYDVTVTVARFSGPIDETITALQALDTLD